MPSPFPQNRPTHGSGWPARLFIGALLLLAFGLLIHPMGDPDVYIHLRDGRFWVENHFHVDREPFGYTIPDKPLERVEVLFRAGIYLAWQLGGSNLLILLKALAMTTALWLLGVLVYRRWRNLGVTAVLLGLAVLAPMNRIMPVRPYVLTYLLLPLVLLLLERFRQAAQDRLAGAGRQLWWLPALAVPWVNMHPGFIVVFGFLGAAMLDDLLAFWRTRDPLAWMRAKHLGGVTLATFAAGALNPLGFGIYAFVFKTTATQDFMRFLTEWAPPIFSQEPLFFILLAVVWLTQLLAWRTTRVAAFIPLAAFSYLAYKSYRNMPLFLIAALPVLAANLHYLWNRYFPGKTFRPQWRAATLIAGTVSVLALLAFATVKNDAFRLGEIKHMYPEKGLTWLLNHPLKGRLLTHDIWGGYTGWHTHGRIQVFIDGRFPSFGEKLYADYRKMIWGDPRHCLPLLDHYRIQGVLVSPKNDMKFYHAIWKSHDWALVYWDDECLLYVRKSPENESLLKFFRYYAIDPKRSPYYNPAMPELALQEAKRAAEIAPHAFLPRYLMGELYLKTGSPELAQAAFADVLERAPQHSGALYNLGMLALQNREMEKAEDYFRRTFKTFPSAQREMVARTAYQLAQTLKADPKRRTEALRWARKARRAKPGWKEAVQLENELGNAD